MDFIGIQQDHKRWWDRKAFTTNYLDENAKLTSYETPIFGPNASRYSFLCTYLYSMQPHVPMPFWDPIKHYTIPEPQNMSIDVFELHKTNEDSEVLKL